MPATVVDLRSAAPQPDETAAAETAAAIEGHIDAVQDGRVYGWAWDRTHPDDRLEVELRLERDGGPPLPLGRVVADRPRADLADNRIGDGAHAFEAEIILPPDAAPGCVNAVLRSPTTGATEVLTQPNAEEQRFDQLLTPHLQRIAERIDAVRRDQRQLAAAQQTVGRLLRDLNEGIAAARNDTARTGTTQADRQEALAESLRDVTERVGSLEVFLIRMDSTLRGFDSAIANNGTKSGGLPMLPLISAAAGAFLATLSGIALFHWM
ncbi:hypothetical protein [Azospirillum doebereinerae]|uniref:Uncharacterized protein n=1 Tax=Azospirillum doebereinerae TaxID=92933 RepID=A0A3S0V6M7_9PROT|nr:hypothetical protein [Azospirillum doebereinerae]MCG5238831.1 hypothetical protein [Azospirillum doebereinerae]RUQ72137.1 hypothetical protein EJ913_11290 [Azospirillum doebereinerae]